MARTIQVTFDAADPGALSRFWCDTLGYEIDAPPAGHASWDEALEAFGVPREKWNSASACHDPDGDGPRLFFQQVPEPKVAKNRVHIDVRVVPDLRGDERMAALEAECERLVAIGATRIRRHDPDGRELGFIVLTDPEGNEFCLD